MRQRLPRGENVYINMSIDKKTVWENKTFNRKTFDVNLVMENLIENKKLVLKGVSTNYENDGGMPHNFQIIHNDFNQIEIDEMLSEFKNAYHRWSEQQQNND